MFTQIGCTADLITGIRAEELTPSGLKKFVFDVKPVTISIKDYIIAAVQLIQVDMKHQKDATITNYNSIPVVHLLFLLNILKHGLSQAVQLQQDQELTKTFHYLMLLICVLSSRNILDMLLVMKIHAIMTSTDEYEDSLAIPRGTATRKYNPNTNITSFFITIQYERNSNGALTFVRLDTQN
ncbi:MAG: hypothetical protein EZS28_006696 [Streblomastix strix]|uniref:Uncharacterized protein n=1 Tax=Streblomastix strix TaxID=222440 RepID=A0A5J4WTA1_9EUKA|nr:MAG: hypothetical protein EZS28_006696 [Streblomastix strix]